MIAKLRRPSRPSQAGARFWRMAAGATSWEAMSNDDVLAPHVLPAPLSVTTREYAGIPVAPDAIVLTPRFEMADFRRGSFVYDKDRLLVPPDAGVGSAPDDRPGGIPGDLGRVAGIKSTVDVDPGYDATWRGEILKTQHKGLTELKGDGT